MKMLWVGLVVLLCQSPLLAQHYLTIGAGFQGMLYGSDDLDRFKDTYNTNTFNVANLAFPMKGFGAGVGFRLEGGFRRFSRFSAAMLVGWQNYTGNDGAQFRNGETRNLELKIKSFFIESELGYGWNKIFVNALVALSFNRRLTMESKYEGEISGPLDPLSGTYKSGPHLTTDLGIAAGVFKAPLFLVLKIAYPVYTGGQSNILEDPQPQKIADGFNFFPDDFNKFVNRETYKGVASDVDGLKMLITVAVAISIFSAE
ncbi:MAG: hypothetical protein ONA90_01125 [candidate division KSB1 bacterium]|nr:hypothetical protein [candidate division KSB1 bacterium]